ncbi:MAG: hypothetical protein JWM57_2856 [Phycisphaerales bacterium]|nr:hypothetical protein [Phycisphaerales bacterium]
MAAEKNSDTSDREISSTRRFAAPRELVFRMLTEPEHIVHWWGPNGFTLTIETMDVRAGGVWKFVMHGPDGRNYDNENHYTEVKPPERLAFEHRSSPNFSAEIVLKAVGDETELMMRMVFATAELRNMTAEKFDAVEGQKQTLNRLADYLTVGKPFEISRTFDAPRDIVWRAWTEQDRLAEWFGPKGARTVSAKLDLRPGGTYHVCMHSAGMGEMWGKWVFREVIPPRRLVWVNSFSDAAGNIARHPMVPVWPRELLSTVTFDEAGPGKTTVTLQWSPINATPEERQTFDGMKESMTGGWTGTFDRLTEYLAKS